MSASRAFLLSRALTPCVALTLAAAARAGDGLPVTYVTDSTDDVVLRLTDVDTNGDYNGADEVVVFYADTLGSIELGNNVGIGAGENGVVYVCDSTSDIVLALFDLDGDGDCHDVDEHWVFFDGNPGGNASGIEMVSAMNLWVDGSRVWIATANTTSGIDQVFYIEDLDQDGDANDVDEAVTYYAPPTSGSTGDSIVQDVKLGLDGNLYYLETGSTGFHAKGVYRLVDLDANGVIDPGTEVNAFFLPPAQAATAFFWGFSQGADGSWFMADTGNELVWRFRDDDDDGTILNGSENLAWWTSPASSTIWQVHATADGSLYCAESQAPDSVLRMHDSDRNGTIDPLTEVSAIYDSTLSPIVIANPRGLFVLPREGTGNAYCFGDGSATLCPCGNDASAESGCANGTGAGVVLSASGDADVAADTLVLAASGGPAGQPGLFFQGDNAIAGGAGVAFGDGLRCAGDAVVRLQVVPLDGAGAASSSLVVSVKGGVSAGETKRYQYWYRDPSSGPCGTGYNLSNGLEVDWN